MEDRIPACASIGNLARKKSKTYMSEIPHHLPPGTYLHGDTYRIVRFIAAGGFGCTYEAEHVLLRKRIAIKEFFMQDYCNRDADTNWVTVGTQSMHELVDKYRQRFLDEARALSGLHHEGIVSVSDVFEENGTAYYVMDYVEGQSLAKCCKGNPLPEKAAIYYIRQVCEALMEVHDQGRLHLDIKPDNIMVKSDGRTLLIDFGTSKQFDIAGGGNTATTPVFTPGYAPLEQTLGDAKQYLPATDIYALGATLYALLTGRAPLQPAARLNQGEGLTFPDGISAATRHAVEKALEIRMNDRPQSVREFIALLDAAIRPARVATQKASQPSAPPQKQATPANSTDQSTLLQQSSLPQPTQNKKKAGIGRSKATQVESPSSHVLPPMIPKPVQSVKEEQELRSNRSKQKQFSVPVETVRVEACKEEEEDDMDITEEPVQSRKRYLPLLASSSFIIIFVTVGIIFLGHKSKETGSSNGYDYVDLGLSVKWATCNVGASSPEDFGNYYAWGETVTKSEYTYDNCKTNKLKIGDIGGDTSYDAARATWGGNWRLPTKEEYDELVNNCTYKWTTQNEVEGMLFTSKKNGNSIFFPATGNPSGGYPNALYWSSTPHEHDTTDAYCLEFYSSGYVTTDWELRHYEHSVRAVLE